MGICGSRLYLMSIFFFFFFSISSLPGWSAWFLNSLVSRGTFGNGTIRIRKRRIIKKWNERDEVAGEHARWRGRPKGGLYVYVYSLYSRENKWKKNKFIFLEKYFLNKYIDDPAQSIRWSSTFFLLFFFFFFLYPSPMLTHSLLPNNFPNDLEFMQLMTRSRLDRQTELYALSSCNSHSSWDRKQDQVFFLLW